MAPLRVKLGLTRFLEQPGLYLDRGSRVGFVGNYNAVDEQGLPFIRLLCDHPDIQLAAIFAPEHGVWGAVQAGVRLSHDVDEYTQAPVFSLYGDTLKPTPDMLEGIDVLLIDARDSGCRYTTGSSTMALCMEAAAEKGIPVIVTDRPNPLGGRKLAGGVLEPEYSSFVGFHTLAVRHGMTGGELAKMYNGETGLSADLTVVPLQGYGRDMLYPDTGLLWVSSPNMPGFETAVVYPGTCLFEGTSCSEGRGTTKPFRLIGSPWLNEMQLADELNSVGMQGVVFRAARFLPMFSKHCNELCHGVEVHVTDPTVLEAVALGVHMTQAVRRQDPEAFQWQGFAELASGKRLFIDLLTGSGNFRRWIEEGRSADQILETWQAELPGFVDRRSQYLLYG